MPWSKRRSRSSKCFVSGAVRPGCKTVKFEVVFLVVQESVEIKSVSWGPWRPPAQWVCIKINGKDQIGDVSGRPMPCWQRTLSHAGLAA